MKRIALFITFLFFLIVYGCGVSAYLNWGSTSSGVVVINNSEYSLQILFYGPAGLEAIRQLKPGISTVFFINAYPREQNIIIVAKAVYDKRGHVISATRSFYFSSWDYYRSDLRECVFSNSDFRRR